MTLILAIVPVLLLIVLMAFFKMPGDKSSVISLIITILIALFGFHYAVDNLVFSFVYGALKAGFLQKRSPAKRSWSFRKNTACV